MNTCDSSSPSTPCTCGRDTASVGSVTSTVPTPPDPGAGYRLLGEDEAWCSTDQFHWSGLCQGWTSVANCLPLTLAEHRVRYPGLLKTNGPLHVRRKIKDPIAELTAKLTEARDNAAKAACHLAALEAAHKEATEIRVGDWVIDIEQNLTPIGSGYHLPNGRPKVGDIHRVRGLVRDTGITIAAYPLIYHGTDVGWALKSFRRATPAEIAAHLAVNPPVPPLPKIHGYEGTFTKLGGYVTYGCAQIGIHLLRAIPTHGQVIGEGNRAITSITLDSGKTLTIADIRAILAHVDYVNSH